MNLNSVVSSKRIYLRALTTIDADVIYKYRNLKEVERFQDWRPTSAKEVEDYANEMANRRPFCPGYWYQLVMVEAASQNIIGDTAVCIDTDTEKTAELGIALNPKYQKKGFAKEVTNSICEFLFCDRGIHRIHVSIDARNAPSLALYSSVGFRNEGVQIESCYSNGVWCDNVVMAILKREWNLKKQIG